MNKNYYPFTAIIGQEAMKKALLLNVVNPKIGGVLINGEKGTAKSTAVRALAPLIEKKIVELPLSISEDRLVGSIDMEKTLASGSVYFEAGVLKKADKNILYVDEVNLLQDYIIDILLDISANGVNHIEREGVSFSHASEFILIGTMNREEGELRSHFLDRFGLSVNIRGEKEPRSRVEILKRQYQYEENRQAFCQSYGAQDAKLKAVIIDAKERMKGVVVTEENLEKIISLCLQANVIGHRADLVMEQTAKAIAALNGRLEITDADIEEAAFFALTHRQRDQEPQQQDQENSESPEPEDEADPNENQSDPDDDEPPSDGDGQNQEESEPSDKNDDKKKQKQPNQPQTENFKIGQDFKLKDFGHQSDRRFRRGQGKRTNIRSASKSGRYIFSTMQRKNNDLALDATIRAAAPFQREREPSGMAITIYEQDIREKVRQKKIANLLVFVVDASGSMGANQRMVETKGAIMSLLKDAYVKRDKICLVAFRGEEAQVLLPPTRSVERGYKLLENMEIGGRTPLNAGLSKGIQVIKSELKKAPELMPMMIVITDGKGNVSLADDQKPKAELLEIGAKIRDFKQVSTMVIDIEKQGMMRFGIAKDLAVMMNSEYRAMDELQSDKLLNIVESMRVTA
ncbi:VWA domain-containing protein [Acetobacterium paludosum]|uniref:VWA domain-containing protein n=1 Tax=Acetobacterium paludosum TaxID=52693 RepID=A0A923HV86_9FIRM|nr:VWA domain-containing protein [Acetobacterium paludosum]MBC3887875.1 VWA domain-containing protein [Acetobacterium paludosum]